MSAKKGFKKHGMKAIDAIFREFKKINGGVMPRKPGIAAVNPDDISQEVKNRALEAVNLIKEKRNGKIKGRTCANGAKQRKYVKDGDNCSSPTASLEAILATLIIDALEDRHVSISDIPGTYLHALMPSDKNVF